MRKIVMVCLFAFAAVCLQAQNFSWEIKFLRGREFVSLTSNRSIPMETGEEFQISIKPASDCFAYMVCYDSVNNIDVFYNGQLEGGIEKYIFPFGITITDPPGTETLFVIMSLGRQERLESLIRNFNNNPGSIQNADNLRMEIAELQRKTSELGQPPSAFIPSAGTSRGSTEEYATRFSERDLYVRPIVIRH